MNSGVSGWFIHRFSPAPNAAAGITKAGFLGLRLGASSFTGGFDSGIVPVFLDLDLMTDRRVSMRVRAGITACAACATVFHCAATWAGALDVTDAKDIEAETGVAPAVICVGVPDETETGDPVAAG